MKTFLVSRPGDFGVLEDHWDQDPVFLPLPGGTVLDLHEASLRALGVTEVRLLRCHPAGRTPDLAPLEEALAGRVLTWSVRGWPLGPWPRGWTLPQALAHQSLFLGADEALVFSVPAADPRGWLGTKVPHGFPSVEVRSLAPWKWEASGRLVPWDGPVISLGGTRDFFHASLRLLETLPPTSLGLKGIHRQATLEPPLSLGTKVRADARSHLGPLVELAAGSRLEPGTTLSRTLVLTPTRFTKDQSVADKIIIGDTVVEPLRGDTVPLPAGH
jgi:hypothetical protein